MANLNKLFYGTVMGGRSVSIPNTASQMNARPKEKMPSAATPAVPYVEPLVPTRGEPGSLMANFDAGELHARMSATAGDGSDMRNHARGMIRQGDDPSALGAYDRERMHEGFKR